MPIILIFIPSIPLYPFSLSYSEAHLQKSATGCDRPCASAPVFGQLFSSDVTYPTPRKRRKVMPHEYLLFSTGVTAILCTKRSSIAQCLQITRMGAAHHTDSCGSQAAIMQPWQPALHPRSSRLLSWQTRAVVLGTWHPALVAPIERPPSTAVPAPQRGRVSNRAILPDWQTSTAHEPRARPATIRTARPEHGKRLLTTGRGTAKGAGCYVCRLLWRIGTPDKPYWYVQPEIAA